MKLLETKWYWLWVSFIAGAASMALEISAARLLAPHYGTSTIVWSSIIGIVLLALSAGYYVGGKLAERRLDDYILLRIVFAGGICALLIPLASRPLLALLTADVTLSTNITFYLAVGSVLSSLLLFGLPVFLLGCISPYLLSLLAKRFGHIGTTSGQLFAISTIGGLMGTFLPTLLLIPLIGTTKTILSIAGVLILTGLPGISAAKNRIASVLLILAITALSVRTGIGYSEAVLTQTESPYQHIQITQAGAKRFMQFDAGFGYQSVYDPNELLTGYYFDYVSTLPSLLQREPDQKISVLIIGLAGGTLARQLHAFYGNAVNIAAVEIDRTSTKLAQKYMGLADIPLRLYYQDGRPFLATDTHTYDLIVVDAYHNELQIPWTMTTQEFWQLVKNRLNKNGIAAMNLVALGAQENLLARTITNTQAQVFPYVYDIPLRLHTNANHLVLLTNDELTLSPTPRTPASIEPLLGLMSERITRRLPDSSQLTLTDDRAPLEWLMAEDAL